jgi:hypothetical protein
VTETDSTKALAERPTAPQRTDAPQRAYLTQLRYGFWIVLVGMGTVAVLFGGYLRHGNEHCCRCHYYGHHGKCGYRSNRHPSRCFFGQQLGSAGKERAEAARHKTPKGSRWKQ